LFFRLENFFSSGFFNFRPGNLFFEREICFSGWKNFFPADFLIFRLEF